MVELNTSEMETIDREIRDQFDLGDKRILRVMEGVYKDIIDPVWAEDVCIYEGNAYSVITTGFWGRKFCKWEGSAKFEAVNSTSLVVSRSRTGHILALHTNNLPFL